MNLDHAFDLQANPSIEMTNNGLPQLLTFAGAVPPLFSVHLKP